MGLLGSRGADLGGELNNCCCGGGGGCCCCCCCCWRGARGGARGELFCGFQRREAGGRGGPGLAAAGYRPRRLRPKMLVSDQRWGAPSFAVAAGGAVGGWGVREVMVTGRGFARLEIGARPVRAASAAVVLTGGRDGRIRRRDSGTAGPEKHQRCRSFGVQDCCSRGEQRCAVEEQRAQCLTRRLVGRVRSVAFVLSHTQSRQVRHRRWVQS